MPPPVVGPATTEEIAVQKSLTAELMAAMKPDEVAERMFAALDADADGKVMLHAGRARGVPPLARRLAQKGGRAVLFEALDEDSDGSITLAELRAGLDKTANGKLPLLWLMALWPPPAGVGVFADLVRAGERASSAPG